jgi:NADH:ubiquinone oxidoreductase subunit F (NADH-binding)
MSTASSYTPHGRADWWWVMTSTGVLHKSATSRGDRSFIPRLLPADDSGTEDLKAHLDRHGSQALNHSTNEWRHTVLYEIERAGLLGRGGAAFPTGQKLRAVLAGTRRPVVIGNGTEGEPASMKDRVLLARAPHLVLDGAAVAADIVMAGEIVMVVHREARMAVDIAVDERRQRGIDRVPVRVVTASDRFVGGEASAVVNWVERGRAVPMDKPPRMSERGLGRRPTLVQNVETLAQLALICRYGSEWYREIGTPEEYGSMLVTLTGSVERAGVHEVVIGSAVKDILALAGGPSEALQALLIGGYFGTWIPGDSVMTLPFSSQGLGIGLGAGLIVAFPASACGLVETARLARYLAAQSAGQCGPCKFGLPAIAHELEMLAEGRPVRINDLRRWLVEVDGRGACSHPDGAARQIRSALDVFHFEVDRHLEGWCSASDRTAVLPFVFEGGSR